MIGTIDIAFKPGGRALPNILKIIGEEGHTLHALRLIPCFSGERLTLKVDIGSCRPTPEILELARRLLQIEDTIEVVHGSRSALA